MKAWQTIGAASLALLALVGRADAQARAGGQPAQCSIDFNNPRELKDANAAITLAAVQQGRPDEQKKQMQRAMGLLTKNPEKFKQPAGRDMLVARTLAWWAAQPGTPETMRKADLGYAQDQAGEVNLLRAADSLFTQVEKAAPDCVDEATSYRSQPWARFVNAAGPFVDAGQFDTAAVLLRRADMIYRDSPFSYYFQSIIYDRQNEPAKAHDALQKTLQHATAEQAKDDSVLAQIREYALYSTALQHFRVAEAAEGDAKRAAMKRAADAFQAYLAEYPGGVNAQAARTGLTSSLGQAGDTATLARMQVDMVTNPTNYSDLQLFEAGTDAFNAGRHEQAARLFEAGLSKNAMYRPALYNLTNAYFALRQWDKMHEVAQKLVQVDPNSPDNWQLLAIAQEGVFKGNRPTMSAAQTDSVRKINARSEQLKTRIFFTEFSHEGATHTLRGSIESSTDEAREIPVTFEFMNSKGQVVASKETVVKVPAQTCKTTGTGARAQRSCTPGKESFSVQVQQEGISAFKYQPIT